MGMRMEFIEKSRTNDKHLWRTLRRARSKVLYRTLLRLEYVRQAMNVFFSTALFAAALGSAAESQLELPSFNTEVVCAKEKDQNARTSCANLEADGHHWLSEYWSFAAEGAQQNCRESVVSYVTLAECISVKLSAGLIHQERLSGFFGKRGDKSLLIGCWRRHVGPQATQDWCFTEDGNFDVSELASGHGVRWEGRWDWFAPNRLVISNINSTSQSFNCEVSFDIEFTSFAQTGCRSSDDRQELIFGILRRVKS